MNGKVVRFVTFAIYHSLYLGSSGRLHVRFPLWVFFQSVNVDGYMSYFVFLLPFQLRFFLRFFWVGYSLLLTFILGTYDQSFDQLWFYVPQNCFSEAIVQLRLFALLFQFIEILSSTWGTFWFILHVMFSDAGNFAWIFGMDPSIRHLISFVDIFTALPVIRSEVSLLSGTLSSSKFFLNSFETHINGSTIQKYRNLIQREIKFTCLPR